MIEIQVNFSDASIITKFGGNYSEAEEFYIGNVFSIANDVNRVCLSIEELN